MIEYYIQQIDGSYFREDVYHLYFCDINTNNGYCRKYTKIPLDFASNSVALKVYVDEKYFLHRADGPAHISKSRHTYAIHGKICTSKEAWFKELAPKERILAAWSLDENF